MAIEIVQRKTCDWCGDEQETGPKADPITTHRLVWDRLAREVETHSKCQGEATVAWLLDKGRKPSEADVRAAQALTVNGRPAKELVPCPVQSCGKPTNGTMGLAQHLAQMHKDIPADERKSLVASAKERLSV